MAGQPPYGYYGPDYRSQKPAASRHPYRASTGNAASLYGGGGGGGGGRAYGATQYRDTPDDWSHYDDDFTDDSVSEDLQRLSLGGAGRYSHGQVQQQQQQQHQQQHHPQARYNTYAASVAAGRNAPRGYSQSQRPPSPTDSSYSQTTASASTNYGTQAYAHHAAQVHAQKRIPSKSLDRFSHYLQKGYRITGPYRGEEDNVEPEYEDRSRGVVMPARSAPRTSRSMRRPSSPDARIREAPLRKGPQYYAESERRGWQRSASQERLPRELERHGRPPHLVRRSSSIGRFDSLSQADKTETVPPPSGALVRRSKSVGPREAMRRRRSLGAINANPEIMRDLKNPHGTAVRLDLGGREVDIAVNDRDKRRGPAIGSITINQNGVHKENMGGPGAPSDSGKTRTTTDWADRARRFFNGDNSSSPPTSPETEEFARMERKFSMRQRPRSASLGTTLPRRKRPLQIGAPPIPGEPVPQTPGGDLRHTRISRKIVTRQALEELGYEYEDTGDTFTVYDMLRPEQIDQLMDMTARIRAARHDRRRARSRGERQYAEVQFDDYRQRKPAPAPLRPVVSQEQKPYASYRDREPPSAGPPMPGAWPSQATPQPRNLPMPDHIRYQRAGPGNLGGPPPQQQAAPARGYSRGEGKRYW